MSWPYNDPDPYANHAGYGAHGAYSSSAPYGYSTNGASASGFGGGGSSGSGIGARGGYPGYAHHADESQEELYENPDLNFSQPRVGYDPNDPRSVHSEYYECDPLEGHGPGGPPAGPSASASAYSPYEAPRRLPVPPGQAVPAGVYADARLSQSQESHGVYHDAAAWDGSDDAHDDDNDKKAYSTYSYAPYAVVENYMTPSVASLPLGSKMEAGESGRDLLEAPPPRKQKGFWGRLFSTHVEEKGIERIPESERSRRHLPGLLLLWWSVNLVVSTFPIGVSEAWPLAAVAARILCSESEWS